MSQSLFTSPWATRQEFFDRLGTALGTPIQTYSAGKRGVQGDFSINDLQMISAATGDPYAYTDPSMGQYVPSQYRSQTLEQLFPGYSISGGEPVFGGGEGGLSGFAPFTFNSAVMPDPAQTNRHAGRWSGTLDPQTGKISGLQWINESTTGGFLPDLLTDYGWAIPLAFAGAGAAGMLGGAPGAGLSAGAIEGAVGLPELGLATQTGLGGSMTLPTAGLGGLMEGVAPALPSGTGLGLTGGAGTGISGGALTGSPLLTGGGLASGLEGLATVGGSSFGWLGDLAKSALGKDGWLPSVLNAFSQNQQGNIQRDWAERLYQDRAQFLQRLARTYTNPEEFLSGPEYQALSRTTLDQLQRQDAAKGRLAGDAQRQKLMQDYAFEYLNKYRTGLASAAGLTQTTGIPELDKSGAANIWGTLNAPLSQIARGVTNDSFDIGGVVDRIFNLGSWFE